MAATATNLKDLHTLHQRAKALRDRLVSGPKTLAGRQAYLSGRRAAVDEVHKALLEERVQVKKREHALQAQQAKIDDLQLKRNQAKKNEEYKAIQNQIAHDEKSVEKLEIEIIEAMIRVDERAAELAAVEAEVAKTTAEVAALDAQIVSHAAEQEAQLKELEQAITEAEAIIPIDQRDQYRRNVKQRGADAFASVDVENKACAGCFVSVTAQTINELLSCVSLNFCKTCGRILYLSEDDLSAARRSAM
jgi:uncharacterized protein